MRALRSIRRYYRPIYAALGIGAIVAIVMLFVLQGLPFFTRAELNAYDFHFQQRGARPAPNNLVVVYLDQTSINDLNGSAFPIPRNLMTKAINFLARAHTRAIGLDFLYFRKTANDAGFAQAMRRAGDVVIPSQLDTPDASNFIAAGTQITLPPDILTRAAAGTGVANVPQDYDNAIRALDLMQVGPGGQNVGGALYPALAVRIASVALHKPVSQVVAGLPNHMLINYVGPQNPANSAESLPTVQFEGLVTGEMSPSFFNNKIVLIMCANKFCNDTKISPFGQIYGGIVQASAIDTILNRDPITAAGDFVNDIIILLVTLIASLVAARFGIWRSTLAVVGIAVGYVFLNIILFSYFRVWAYLVTPELALILAFAGIMALRFATEERQRRRTSKIFGQYVKPEIVDILVNATDEETALAGARRPLTVLFVDVRGFTRMSESLQPEDVVTLLDIYLEELTQSVQMYDGTLLKYVGDEIMAIWNAPRYQEDHALLAIQSGLEMVARTDRINAQLRERGMPPIRFGIGINSGESVVGQMGSSLRKQYDVIGDAINTGARLCSAAGGGEIIVGEETWALAGDRLEGEETEPLKLKGKSEGFRTYFVFGLKPEAVGIKQPVPAPA